MTNREWFNSLSDRHLAELIVHPQLEKGIRGAIKSAANEWEAYENVEEWLKAEREVKE